MVVYNAELEALRFGTGLSKDHEAPEDLDAWFDSVDGTIERAYPMPSWDEMQPSLLKLQELKRQQWDLVKAKKDRIEVVAKIKVVNQLRFDFRDQILRNLVSRGAFDTTGFSFRLSVIKDGR